MSSVDLRAGSATLGGRGGGGGRGGRGGKGHYTPKVGGVPFSFGVLTFVRSSHFRPEFSLSSRVLTFVPVRS
jgi:hypothetical protein